MPIIDTARCNLLYSKDAESGFQPKAIKDDMLCAGFAEGKKDACKVGAGVGCARGRALLPRPGPAGRQLGWDERVPSRWGHGPDQSLASGQWGPADSGPHPAVCILVCSGAQEPALSTSPSKVKSGQAVSGC